MAKSRKPTPGMLGTGMAARAAKGLQGRRARLDEAIDGPAKPAPKKSAPKRKK